MHFFLSIRIPLESCRKICLFYFLHGNAERLLEKNAYEKNAMRVQSYSGMLLSHMNNLRWILMQLQAKSGKCKWAQKTNPTFEQWENNSLCDCSKNIMQMTCVEVSCKRVVRLLKRTNKSSNAAMKNGASFKCT